VETQTILTDLTNILNDLTADWDTSYEEGIGPATRLIGDLNFESIDVVQLITAVEEHFRRRDLPFEQLLMKEGQYVDEVSVGEMVDFLAKHLN